MTNDDGRKPEGAPERRPKAGVGAPSGVDGNSTEVNSDGALHLHQLSSRFQPINTPAEIAGYLPFEDDPAINQAFPLCCGAHRLNGLPATTLHPAWIALPTCADLICDRHRHAIACRSLGLLRPSHRSGAA